jgi:5,10-methylenetetrahydromethanopterin reductase
VRIGVRFEPDWDPSGVLSYARSAEELGYDELWFSEDCFWPGGVAMASAALAVTTRIEVGVGLFAAAVRNPATAAMEIGALAAIAPARVTVAFGHGMADWMDQIGARSTAPLALLDETVQAVRGLLRGEKVCRPNGPIHLVDVQLGNPPCTPPPVLIGTTGPKGLALAGRVADGVLLPELSCQASVRWAAGEMRKAGSSGRVVVFAHLNLDSVAPAAVAAVEPLILRLVRTGAFPYLVEHAGIDATGVRRLDADTVRMMSVAGNPDDCVRALRRWDQAGVDSLVLIPPSRCGREQVARFATEVLPDVRLR